MGMLRWTEDQMREYHAKRQGKKEAKAEAKAHQKDQPRAKYRNKKTHIDGKKFDSKAEADRYIELKRMQEGSLIFDLKCQVPFVLEVNRHPICKYVADFVYVDVDGNRVVEDVKGFRTRDYVLKKKLMLAVHGIAIHEFVKKSRGRAGKP